MKAKDLMDAVGGIDDELITAAEEYKKTKRFHLPKWAAAAACLVIIAAAGLLILPRITLKDGPRKMEDRYREGVNVVMNGEAVMEWPWEWKTAAEQAVLINFEGERYVVRGRAGAVSRELLGEKIGEGEAEGYDVYTDTVQRQSVTVYAIKDVDRKYFLSADIDGEFMVYYRENMTQPRDLGALMDLCSLPEKLTLSTFCEKDGFAAGGWYVTDRSEEIWKILEACREAPCFIDDDWRESRTEGISFLAASEALGIYDKAFTVTKDGVLFTNLTEYGFAFRIGEEAAEKIIALAKKGSRKTELEPRYRSIAGKLTEIGDDYILIDDSVLCKNPADGIVYRVKTDDIRIRRCLEFAGGFKPGDLVAVEYMGSIDAENGYTVSGGISLWKGYLESNGEVTVQE